MKFKALTHVLVLTLSLGTIIPAQADSKDAGRIIGGIIGGLIGHEASDGKAGATIVGALIGGLIGGEVAEELSEADRQVIYREHRHAYDGDMNRPYRWRGERTSGHVTIIEEGYYQQRRCRRYTSETVVVRRHRRTETYTSQGWVCNHPGRGWVKTENVIVDRRGPDRRDGGRFDRGRRHRVEYVMMDQRAFERLQRRIKMETFDSNRAETVDQLARTLRSRNQYISGKMLADILKTYRWDWGSYSRMSALKDLAPYTVIRASARQIVQWSRFDRESSEKDAERELLDSANFVR
ncbi:MAG: DUF4476 domain-containing protein [Bdellovibrionales bacterium]|nr:DUF4476 domain-containing protein [Bdellovibrionales bacterium]